MLVENKNKSVCNLLILVFVYTIFTFIGAEIRAQTYDYGDAPYVYPTLNSNSGARHVYNSQIYMGSKIDTEQDGIPGTLAQGDDLNNQDDEDGVNFTSSIKAGNTAYVNVNASTGNGYLSAWIDFNYDHDWADTGEKIFNNKSLKSGDNNLSFSVPSGASPGYTYARFRFSTQQGLSYKGTASDGEVEDYRVTILEQDKYDFGDAPSSYPTTLSSNGARHLINQNFRLGSKIDDEIDGIPSSDAKGDDNNNDDDEDGVNFTTDFIKGSSVSIIVTASTNGKLNAWMDFNDDGDWADAGEQVFTNRSLSAGSNALSFNVPSNADAGYTFIRFRFNSNGGLSYSGQALEGEVEDYRVLVKNPAPAGEYDFGDAPYPYPTKIQQNGAQHLIDETLFLGQGVDSEADGQPDSTATGDDNEGNDDEDGVEWLQKLVPNDSTLVRITASKGGFLKAWIDWNQDGDWEDEGEEVIDSQVAEGANELEIFVPEDAVEGPTYARFRYSDEIIPSFEGEVNGGEVEDMRIYIENFRFYDYGDAPDDSVYHYPTLLEHNGARHTVSDTIYLGDFDLTSYTPSPPPDVEGDGLPTADADGDDNTNLNDEQGVYFWQRLVSGDTSSVMVFFKGIGILHGWFDWNQDGDWSDPGEYTITYEPSSSGYHLVKVPVPETALLGSTYARFRYSVDPFLLPYGRGGCGEVEDWKCRVYSDAYDYGDAPESYGTLKPNGASHKVQALIALGTYLDTEPDGQPGDDALNDDNDTIHFDDEDGVIFSDMIPGEESSFQISTRGKIWLFLPRLHGWIDFNHDGDFEDTGEKIFEGFIADNGTNTYLRTIPADAHLGYTYARFRFTDYPLETLGPNGENKWAGEVEDYRVRIGEIMFDYGDAPFPFKTSFQQNGARHIIDLDIYLGYSVDAEADGQPDSLAMGDDINDNNDDDDGVAFQGTWILGDTVTAIVTASTNGYLSIWGANAASQNFNKQLGAASDFPFEKTKIELQQGENSVEIIVDEENFTSGAAYFRFRYSTQPIDSADGIAIDGEVEDYRVEVFDRIDFPAEYGDAPEGIIAYPDRGVNGSFPTLKDGGPAGFIRHGTRGRMYLGYEVDYELDGDEGTAAPVGDPWDTDEGLNDRRGDVVIYTDLGLTDPCNYTIRGEAGSEYYWPYSVTNSRRGVLGDAGEAVDWGDNKLDVIYHVTAEDGAYLNVLIDWNQDGSWGGEHDWHDGFSIISTPEHIIQNFFIPTGEGSTGRGRLSELSPPEFIIPDDVAMYVWTRWTISNTMIAPGWDGSGIFNDGETEDYLIAVNFDSLFDYGDAPQGALAYPSSGVVGEFQTSWGIPGTIGGAIWHHRGGKKYFGNTIDYEWAGNAGLAFHTPWVYDADEDFNNELIIYELRDAGLRLLMPYKIQGLPGSETVVPYIPVGVGTIPRSLGGVGETASWGTNLDMAVHLLTGSGDTYFSLVIDWDQDGNWHTREWVHENFLIPETPGHFHGMLSDFDLPDFEIGPNTGYVWARFILSERPVSGWYGEFFDGETEDYLLYVSERSFRYDWGDAPYPFPTNSQENGARHLLDPEVYLGQSVDAEEEGQPDEKASSDEDDGVSFRGVWIPGDTVTALVKVSTSGFLTVWGDFYHGDEQRVGEASEPLGDGNPYESDAKIEYLEVPIIVPIDAVLGPAYLRFRFSTEPVDAIDGTAPDGEVEDYRVEVFDRMEFPAEYGDAPEGALAYPLLGVDGRFPTCEDLGPSGFVKHGTLGQMYFGFEIDYETDGNAGLCSVFSGNYDADEGLNDPRWDVVIYRDIGLTKPINYTIIGDPGEETHWPYSVYGLDRGILGANCEMAEWGRNIDITYHMTSDEGAYVNVLIDWNQDGQWGGTMLCPDVPDGYAREHVLQNFYIAPGGADYGDLSDLDPPPFFIGPTEGYVWVRFTISDSPVVDDWDGSGVFSDGETEDYLICVSFRGFNDFGDAPEGALAYPSSGVLGQFPTCRIVMTDSHTGTGYIRHAWERNCYLGNNVDYEWDGNANQCPDFTLKYDSDEKWDNTSLVSTSQDAGIRKIVPYTILGGAGFEFVDPFIDVGDEGDRNRSLGSVGQWVDWGTNLDLNCRVLRAIDHAYLNVAIDWNQDGQWGGTVESPYSETPVPEHVVQDFRISPGTRNLSSLDPPMFQIGPNSGYVWARFSIMDRRWGEYWYGQGMFADGETEDYLLKINDFSLLFDYGDAPIISYGVLHSGNGAIHTVDAGLCLGDMVDTDHDGQPRPGGSGDDSDGTDDDDGIQFLTPLIPGETAQIRATVKGTGYLYGWIDFNADSSWDDPGEQIWTGSQVTTGYHVLSFTVPGDAVLGITYARFRFSDTSGLSYNGPPHFSDLPDQSDMPPRGEVEDYAVLICLAGTVYDFGDAPDPTYPTLMASGGAYHLVDPNVYLGNTIDSEGDGLHHAQALGDDNDVSDDEDGVQFPSTITSGDLVSASIILSVQGYLNVWIDLNADGDWYDAYEHVINDSFLIGGTHNVNLPVPIVAIPDSSIFARIRFSTFPGVGVTGPAADGEVEDYLLNVIDTGIDGEQGSREIPTKFALLQNFPNPFNPVTTFRYHLPKEANVVLTIYNLTGSIVRKYDLGMVAAGEHSFQWDGRDALGNRVATGIYFYKMQSGLNKKKDLFNDVKKMILLK